MRFKKLLALCLVGALLVATFAACSNNAGSNTSNSSNASTSSSSTTDSSSTSSTTTDAATPEATTPEVAAPEATVSAGKAMADQYGLPYSGMEEEEPITISYFTAGTAQQISPDNPFTKVIETITNVKIEMEYLVGDAQEKYGVMIASGDMPDLINVGVGEQTRFIEAGSYIPLQDLIPQYAPFYRQSFDKYWPGMKWADGNVYVMSIWGTPIGTQNPVQYNGSAFWIQKDVLDYFGRAPKTVDEYFDMIREYKEKNPTINGVPTIGYEICMTDGWRYWALLNSPKSLAGYANWGDFAVGDTKNNVAIDCYSQPWSRTFIEKLNQEYLKGTILSETLTRDQDQYLATLASGAVLGMYDQLWSYQNAQELLMGEGRFERTYLPLGLTYDSSIKPNYLENGTFTANNGFGITQNCKYPERVLKYADYLLSEEVQTFLSWGIEGEHYYVENGRYMRPDAMRRQQDDDPQWVKDNMGRWLRNMFPKFEGTFSNGNATDPGTQSEEYFASLNDYDKALFTKLGIETRIAFMGEPVTQPAYYPFWGMGIDNRGTAGAEAIARVKELAVKSLSAMVVAPDGQFDSMWNDYQTALGKIDTTPMYDEINAEIQKVLDIYK